MMLQHSSAEHYRGQPVYIYMQLYIYICSPWGERIVCVTIIYFPATCTIIGGGYINFG